MWDRVQHVKIDDIEDTELDSLLAKLSQCNSLSGSGCTLVVHADAKYGEQEHPALQILIPRREVGRYTSVYRVRDVSALCDAFCDVGMYGFATLIAIRGDCEHRLLSAIRDKRYDPPPNSEKSTMPKLLGVDEWYFELNTCLETTPVSGARNEVTYLALTYTDHVPADVAEVFQSVL